MDSGFQVNNYFLSVVSLLIKFTQDTNIRVFSIRQNLYIKIHVQYVCIYLSNVVYTNVHVQNKYKLSSYDNENKNAKRTGAYFQEEGGLFLFKFF